MRKVFNSLLSLTCVVILLSITFSNFIVSAKYVSTSTPIAGFENVTNKISSKVNAIPLKTTVVTRSQIISSHILPPWHIQTIDSLGGNFTSLALDNSDHPHISYFVDNILNYAYWTGKTWQIQTVDNMEGSAIRSTSLALDTSNQPHISYLQNTAFKYAQWINNNWEIETFDTSLTSGSGYPSVALDSSNYPHISYISPDEGLKYAYWTGSEWNIQTLDDGGSWSNSIALDANNNPHIGYAYHENGESMLKYAHWMDNEWSIQVVEGACVSEYCFPQDISLVLDATGHPHMSYSDGWNLMYAYWIDSSWNIQTVVNGGLRSINTSLALAPSGKPRISYSAIRDIGLVNHADLMYAYQLDDKWHIEVVDNGLPSGFRTQSSLAIDSQGFPHISYSHYDGNTGNSNLKYVSTPPPLSLTKQAIPNNNLLNDGILTYTFTLSAPNLEVHLQDPLPSNVEYISGSITGTLTPSAVYSPPTRSIVWHGRLDNATQTIRFQVRPEFTGTSSIQLSQIIVNTAWLADIKHSRIVSATAIVNGMKMYLPIILVNSL